MELGRLGSPADVDELVCGVSNELNTEPTVSKVVTPQWSLVDGVKRAGHAHEVVFA